MALRDIIKGEKDLAEPIGADDDLLKELQLIAPKAPDEKKDSEEKKEDFSSEGQEHGLSDAPHGQELKPFERSLGRDPIGPRNDEREEENESNEDLTKTEDEWEEQEDDDDEYD
jgi:hypothetical protein